MAVSIALNYAYTNVNLPLVSGMNDFTVRFLYKVPSTAPSYGGTIFQFGSIYITINTDRKISIDRLAANNVDLPMSRKSTLALTLGQTYSICVMFAISATASNSKIVVDGSETAYEFSQNGGSALAPTAQNLTLWSTGDRETIISELAMWSGLLDTSDAIMLARRYCPAMIKPQNLRSYCSMARTPHCIKNGVTFGTVSTTMTDHPRVLGSLGL